MPQLPEHPDLDQLRRQARELHRAAQSGDSDVLSILRAVSEDATLASAQLAIAREYGFSVWPALKSAVEWMASPSTQTRSVRGQSQVPVFGHEKSRLLAVVFNARRAWHLPSSAGTL